MSNKSNGRQWDGVIGKGKEMDNGKERWTMGEREEGRCKLKVVL